MLVVERRALRDRDAGRERTRVEPTRIGQTADSSSPCADRPLPSPRRTRRRLASKPYGRDTLMRVLASRAARPTRRSARSFVLGSSTHLEFAILDALTCVADLPLHGAGGGQSISRARSSRTESQSCHRIASSSPHGYSRRRCRCRAAPAPCASRPAANSCTSRRLRGQSVRNAHRGSRGRSRAHLPARRRTCRASTPSRRRGRETYRVARRWTRAAFPDGL